ncbi:hypothetical protein [Streptomyces sp. NBC_00154]|uniref:hypothetical protein n=1 Tax=Streptomyces sp. NBC_00154 TaxID=2975670 RepID=UPI00224FED2F|nr:hypothetical protein [Streptomyces sp. NBC_00154]MCX5317257.1 hypothetical protein [Streptomyces sp. NBC_00154]
MSTFRAVVPIDLQQLPGLNDIQPVHQPAIHRGQSIEARFEAFHALNSWALRHLQALTTDCAAKGFTRVGIGTLFELLRWRYGHAAQGDAFRLNNNFRSRYARLLIERHPDGRRCLSPGPCAPHETNHLLEQSRWPSSSKSAIPPASSRGP